MSATLYDKPSHRVVVVLAAGLGARFQVEGFAIPKPLISFNGTTYLQHTARLAREIAAEALVGEVVVVCTASVAAAARGTPGVDRVVEVDHVQPGPVASALLVMGAVNPDAQVIFVDCDNYYPPSNRSWVQALPFRASFCLVANAPRVVSMEQFCNVLVDETGHVRTMLEKSILAGSYAATGVYGFSSARAFQEEAWGRVARRRPGTEVPMSAVLAALGATEPISAVLANVWLPIGTPEQLVEAARVNVV